MTLSVLTFLTVTLGLLVAFLLPQYLQRDKAKVQRRITTEFRPERRSSASGALFKDADALSMAPADEYALLGAATRNSRNLAWRLWLESSLAKADLDLRPELFQTITLVLGFVAGIVGFCLFGLPGLLPGAALGAGLPIAYLKWKISSRKQRLLHQLPGAFELMARVIRAGQSVPQAFEAVAEAFEEPLRSQFGDCRHQQNLGLRPEAVFQDMAVRSGILELRIFAMAMLIQRQTGGNLSGVLERLAALVRNRLRLKQQVRAMTAEGRLQGLTLTILPFIMFAILFIINRPYARVLLEHGRLLAMTGACMSVGILWIRRIVNFEG